MSKSNSTAPAKPNKPYPDFPLFPHATKRWAKKIRGKLHYFGPWDDPDGALKKYLDQKDALHAGRELPLDLDALTVKAICNAFLNHKQSRLDSGELSCHTWQDYRTATAELVDHLGKQRSVASIGVADFAALRNKMAKKWGPHRLGKTIQCVRSVFKFAFDAGLMERPMRFGPGFARPSKKTLRQERAKHGPKLFEVDEIRKMLEAANQPLKAMILLGINCGLGNSDCGSLPLAAVNLEKGWLDFPRPKTAIGRRCPLWPQTIEAVREWLADRPQPRTESVSHLLFLTRAGDSWNKSTSDNPVSKETRKLLDTLGIPGHRNFYTLRHTFRTVADEAKDQPAVDHVMGHESTHMSTAYRESISDSRLRAVTSHVQRWLFDEPAVILSASTSGLGQATEPTPASKAI